MAEESRLQSRIINDLKKSGWLPVKIKLCSVNGWPDIMAVKADRWILIEAKAKGKKAEPLQKYVHAQLIVYGASVYVISTWEEYTQLKYASL